MRHGKTILIDLRKVGLSQEGWHELRLEAKELGVSMEALAQVAVAALTPGFGRRSTEDYRDY
jgi:hypothetical protein